jgi:hypothetical protein
MLRLLLLSAPLAAVPHVEGIVGLAANSGTVWVVASLVALALLPMPFIADALRSPHGDRTGFAIAADYGMVSVVPVLGPYPVPILGYGLAPMVGYFAALGWIIRSSPANGPPQATFPERSRFRPREV